MELVSLDRCYELRDMYQRTSAFADRKAVELLYDPLKTLAQPLQLQLRLDQLDVMAQATDKREREVYDALMKEFNARRAEIVNGGTTGDIVQDVLFCAYGLNYDPKVDRNVRALVGYFHEFRDQPIAVLHHYQDREDEGPVTSNSFIDFHVRTAGEEMGVRQSPIVVSLGEMGICDPDVGRPNAFLSLMGESYSQKLVGKLRGKQVLMDGIDFDPRWFSRLEYASGSHSIIADVSSLHIPYVCVEGVRSGGELCYFLSKVEIVPGNDRVQEVIGYHFGQ